MIAILGGPLSRVERAALVIGLLLAAGLMWPVRAEISDTTFVWLRIAHHLAQGAGLVFNPGERVYASTNPLWVALLADAMALGLDGLTFARVLGALSTLLTVPLFLQLLRRTVRTPALRALGTVAWASQAWMIRWSMSGLETPLAVALVLGGFVALTEGPEWGDRPVRTGALWALAALTRPGAVLLLALWGTALLIDAQSRPGLRRLVYGMVPVVAIYGSWVVFARVYFGSFWPAVLSTPPSVNPTVAEWWGRLSVDFGRVAGTEGAIVVVGVLAMLFGGVFGWRRDRSALRALPLAFVVLLPALFAARGLEVGARHLLLVIPIVHWLVWWAVDHWWGGEPQASRARARATVLGTVLAAVIVGQNLATYRLDVLPDARRTSRSMNRTLVRWGRWLGAHAPPGTLVATNLPGALAYYGDVRVLDLNGLFTPGMREVRARAPRQNPVVALAFGDIARAPYIVDRGLPSAALLAMSPHARALELLDEADGLAFYRVDWSRIPPDTLSGR